MLISVTTYTAFIFFILGCAFLPFFYFLVKEKKKKFWSFLILLILVPIDMYTPAVTLVDDCGKYTSKVMIFPTGEFERGNHGYIVNNSESALFLETIVYSEEGADIKAAEERIVFAIIAPGETYQTYFGGRPDYIFEDAPESIQMKKGTEKVTYRLSCDSFHIEDWDGEYEDMDSDFEPQPEQSTEEEESNNVKAISFEVK